MARRGVSRLLARRRQRAHASCRHRQQAPPPIGVSRQRSRSLRLRLPLRRSAAARADVVPPCTGSRCADHGSREGTRALSTRCTRCLPAGRRRGAHASCHRCCCVLRLLLRLLRLRLRLRLRLLWLQRSALLMAPQVLQNAAAGRRDPGLPQQRALVAVLRVVAQQQPLRVPLQLRALALSGSRLRHSAAAPRRASASPPPCASPAPPPSVPNQRGRFDTAPLQSGRCPAPATPRAPAAGPRPGRRHVEAAAPPTMLRSPASFARPPPASWPLLARAPPPPPPPGQPPYFSVRAHEVFGRRVRRSVHGARARALGGKVNGGKQVARKHAG
eukprot:scaffold36894_cov63-Phaeocystis_antarctica.AAC.2